MILRMIFLTCCSCLLKIPKRIKRFHASAIFSLFCRKTFDEHFYIYLPSRSWNSLPLTKKVSEVISTSNSDGILRPICILLQFLFSDQQLRQLVLSSLSALWFNWRLPLRACPNTTNSQTSMIRLYPKWLVRSCALARIQRMRNRILWCQRWRFLVQEESFLQCFLHSFPDFFSFCSLKTRSNFCIYGDVRFRLDLAD